MTRSGHLAAIVLGVVALTSCTEGQSSSETVPTVTPPPAAGLDGLLVVRDVLKTDIRLDARVASSSNVVIASPSGTHVELAVEPKATVVASQVVGYRSAVVTAQSPQGTAGISQARLAAKSLGNVTTPVPGVVEQAGEDVVIQSAGLDVVASINAVQLLRYRSGNLRGAATVDTPTGKMRLDCVAIWTDARPGEATSSVHCRLPAAETVPGLPAELHLTADIPSVLQVPNAYIGYRASTNDYYVLIGPSKAIQPVVVGPTNGVRRVILEGVAEGDRIWPLE